MLELVQMKKHGTFLNLYKKFTLGQIQYIYFLETPND